MDAVLLLIVVALLALGATVALGVRRRRSTTRAQWSATRDRLWTVDELDALAAHDLPGDLADLVA